MSESRAGSAASTAGEALDLADEQRRLIEGKATSAFGTGVLALEGYRVRSSSTINGKWSLSSRRAGPSTTSALVTVSAVVKALEAKT